MEFTVRAMMIFVLAVIALLILIMVFSYGQGQSKTVLDSLFDWFKIIGSGD
jgi:hypothetical protein